MNLQEFRVEIRVIQLPHTATRHHGGCQKSKAMIREAEGRVSREAGASVMLKDPTHLREKGETLCNGSRVKMKRTNAASRASAANLFFAAEAGHESLLRFMMTR